MDSKNTKVDEQTWEQVVTDLKNVNIPLQYKALIHHGSTPVTLAIDIDPGGGFEGGFELTSLSAAVPIQFTSLTATVSKKDAFRFALHDEGFMDRVGKVFGMEDIVIGYPEFDKQLIVKTNDGGKLKKVFADTGIRKVFQALTDFSLQAKQDEENTNDYTLELMLDKAITDTAELKNV